MKIQPRPSVLLVAFVAALFTATTPAQAQTTAVSNLGQTVAPTLAVGKQTIGSNDFSMAFSFSTGVTVVNFSGITLSTAGSTGSASGFSVSLYTGISGSGPTGLVTTLSGSSTPTTAGNYTYIATSLTPLLANATYWLAATAPTTPANTLFSFNSTASTAEDSGALSGWSIGDIRYLTNDGGSSWFSQATAVPLFSVQYSAVPEPSTCAALAGLAALGLALCCRRGQAGRSQGA